MSLLTTATGHRMVEGTARILLAEALFPVSALVTTAFLTRHLGPQGYGLLALTLTAIIWIETVITSFFSKATLKFISESKEWKPVGTTIIRFSLLAGGVAMIVIWLVAGPVSALLHEPDLAFYLRLGAVDIPILCLGQAYRSILLGIGQYRSGAIGRAGRWISRLCLVVLLVEMGLSITGALAGVIGSSIVELAISRWYVGSGMLMNSRRASVPLHRYGTMLCISSMCLIAYNGMDLFMLKVLGRTTQQAGIYGAAQSLSLLPGVFAWTFSSLLLATLSRLLADDADKEARELARDAMRVTLGLIPIAAIISGAAPEIVVAVFGPAFATAAPLLSLLVLGAVANVMLIVSLTMMTAAGLLARTVMFAAMLVPLAFAGHWLLIPRWAEQGAALVTVGVSVLGAVVVLASVYALWRIRPPGSTFVRSLAIAFSVGTASLWWPTPGWVVFVKLIGLVIITLFAYWLLGEFHRSEIVGVRSIFLRKTEATQV